MHNNSPKFQYNRINSLGIHAGLTNKPTVIHLYIYIIDRIEQGVRIFRLAFV